VEDEDELNQVSLFVDSPQKLHPDSSSLGAASGPLPLKDAADAIDDCHVRSSGVTSPASSGLEALSSASTAVPTVSSPMYEYSPGEAVSYWSRSHRMWLSATVVERRSRSVYLIDKQDKGVFSKVKACELVCDAECKADSVLRAVIALGSDGSDECDAPASARSAPRSARRSSAGQVHGSRDANGVRGSQRGMSPRFPAPPSPAKALVAEAIVTPRRGRIVRDDFSDDSD